MTAEYPLQWPDGLPRHQHRAASQFKTALGAALANVRRSLENFGRDSRAPVTNIVLSSNVSLGNTSPADTGVAAWFVWDGEQRCIAVDRYAKVQDNLQAIHHILEARRTEIRHGGLHIVRQTFKGFVALPDPNKVDWRAEFGFRPDERVTIEAVDGAHRRLATERHPDRGGSEEAMARLNLARDQARKALT